MARSKARPRQQPRKSSKGMKARQTARTKRNRVIATTSIAAVVVAFVAAIAFGGRRPTPSASGVSDAITVAGRVTGVLASTLDQVGIGQGVTPLQMFPLSTPPLTQNGKPDVFYYGAEYCPYCAGQRWPLTVALSRFGTFSGLGITTSSSTDTAPDTPTITYHGSTYTSNYLAFSPVETQTRTGETLDVATAAQQDLVNTYDTAPYTTQAGAIPFLMIGNRYLQIGSSIDPATLAGMTQLQVAATLSDPTAATTQEIGGAANMFTAALCQLTNGQPVDVCTAPGVTAGGSLLPAAPFGGP